MMSTFFVLSEIASHFSFNNCCWWHEIKLPWNHFYRQLATDWAHRSTRALATDLCQRSNPATIEYSKQSAYEYFMSDLHNK